MTRKTRRARCIPGLFLADGALAAMVRTLKAGGTQRAAAAAAGVNASSLAVALAYLRRGVEAGTIRVDDSALARRIVDAFPYRRRAARRPWSDSGRAEVLRIFETEI